MAGYQGASASYDTESMNEEGEFYERRVLFTEIEALVCRLRAHFSILRGGGCSPLAIGI